MSNKYFSPTKPDTLLVVDDSPESLSFVNDTLEGAGYNVLIALEGRQALSIVQRIRPDLILMDALMPNMDGFETCKALQAFPELSSIPVVFMTGLSDSASVVKGLESGGVDYITKPIDPNELLARIRRHLDNARRTSSAWLALDSAGQHLFSVDDNGVTLWATPQTLALFAKYHCDPQWRSSTLPEQLQPWLEDAAAGSKLLLKLPTSEAQSELQNTAKVLVTLLGTDSSGAHALRLSEADDARAEEVLRTQLSLSRREAQVLYWLSNGKTNWEIATILGIKPRTIDKHLEQIYRKLQVQNRTAAARAAASVLGSL